MITKEQAIKAGETKTELHYISPDDYILKDISCRKIVGPRGGIKYQIERWRSNGRCKVWKTRPNEFSLPIKWGFRGPHSYITDMNAGDWHLASECPLFKEEENLT